MIGSRHRTRRMKRGRWFDKEKVAAPVLDIRGSARENHTVGSLNKKEGAFFLAFQQEKVTDYIGVGNYGYAPTDYQKQAIAVR